jgi:hypothetical protein
VPFKPTLQYLDTAPPAPVGDQSLPALTAESAGAEIAALGAQFLGDVQQKHIGYTGTALALLVADRFMDTATIVKTISPDTLVTAAQVKLVTGPEEVSDALSRLAERVTPYLPVKLMGQDDEQRQRRVLRLVQYAAELAAFDAFPEPMEQTVGSLYAEQRRRSSLGRYAAHRQRKKAKLASEITDEMLMREPCEVCGADIGEPCGPVKRLRHNMRAERGPRMKAYMASVRAAQAAQGSKS